MGALGLMIERTSNMTYRDYVRQHVFLPAGMKDSDFFNMEYCTVNVAEGCDPIRSKDGTLLGWKRNIYSFLPIPLDHRTAALT